MRQPPYQSSTTNSEETKAKDLRPNVKFYIIDDSSECRFECSEKGEYLRKTLYRRIGYSASERIGAEIMGVEIYGLVPADEALNKIQRVSGRWTLYCKRYIKNRWISVYEHVNDQDYITGWYMTQTEVRDQNDRVRGWRKYYRK